MLSSPACFDRKCVFYKGIIQPDGTELTERPACRTYPNGIPDDIAYGKDKHLTVRSDQDNDITYQRSEEED